ncbi:unnamed protein product [Ambrosiozyma monospora]|uniref:Unnamed protein product n=1 Tax=Ambrosiozyma monospora TaxID=43982 RepID=A0ACB5SYP5_AMBMO|nr:unnamed protein product [Ambrosiozyma monospora]
MSAKFVFSEEINPDDLTEQQETEKQAKQDISKNEAQRDRKSLQQQLYSNRIRKYKEFKQKMEKQNSSYKMKSDVSRYYNELKRKEMEKISNEKQAEKDALLEFEKLKHQMNVENGKDSDNDTVVDLIKDDLRDDDIVKITKTSTAPTGIKGIKKRKINGPQSTGRTGNANKPSETKRIQIEKEESLPPNGGLESVEVKKEEPLMPTDDTEGIEIKKEEPSLPNSDSGVDTIEIKNEEPSLAKENNDIANMNCESKAQQELTSSTPRQSTSSSKLGMDLGYSSSSDSESE